MFMITGRLLFNSVYIIILLHCVLSTNMYDFF
jgi:hypothetical protein